MSFICEFCRKAIPDHTKPAMVVTRTRPRTYVTPPAEFGEDETISHGWEIVEERRACSLCAEKEKGER